MSIQRQDTKQRMSRIVIHNDTVYLCGQVCKDATKDMAEQTVSICFQQPFTCGTRKILLR